MRLECWNISGGPFHFGLHGMGEEEVGLTLPSDSLFAAVVAVLAYHHDAAQMTAFLQPFVDESPPFILTSTFIQAGGVRFFPLPTIPRLQLQDYEKPAEQTDLKARKRVRWVSWGVFKRLVSGNALPPVRFSAHGTAISLLDEQLPPEPWWVEDARPRVTIDRTTSASQIFHTGGLSFQQGCGLWFGVQWLSDNPLHKELLPLLLAELADNGLGGNRTAGYGACKINQADTMDLPDPQPGGMWTNLSRYAPRSDEMGALAHTEARYKLETVTGWIDSPVSTGQHRRQAVLVAEGALLGEFSAGKPAGRLLDVRPCYPGNPDPLGHPVYRSGLAVPVGVQGGLK